MVQKIGAKVMVNRMAAATALLVFTVCMIVGGLGADNTFSTTVERALTAMAATLVIGLVVAAMARKMLEENVKSEAEKIKKNWTNPTQSDR
jgi:undecaprenyl pyrophosphate phosphatase UppP